MAFEKIEQPPVRSMADNPSLSANFFGELPKTNMTMPAEFQTPVISGLEGGVSTVRPHTHIYNLDDQYEGVPHGDLNDYDHQQHSGEFG